ncbi:MAG TPA: hypothetical protein DCL38_08450 [Lachnospiraceae bacterium]|nr:hypothetical protein [Lachnospiraceae bacterium]
MTVQEKLRLLKEGYTKEQITELQLGEEAFLDVSYYSGKEFNALQMKEIRLGMEMGLDVTLYAKPRFDWLQMEQIRLGLLKDLNVKRYAFANIPFDVMKELRLGMEEDIDLSAYAARKAPVLREIRLSHRSGVDIIPYVQAGYDEEQLEQIRLALEGNVPIEEYIKEEFRGISLREIRIGLERRVDVSKYADVSYNWRQMREIRLGLEHQVEVDEYLNPMYDWRQMYEIREGLEEGLNTGYYRNLMYTAREMKRRREYMLTHTRDEYMSRDETPVVVNQDNFTITISADKFSATIRMHERDNSSNFKGVIKLLRERNVVYGIKEDVVKRVVAGDAIGRDVVVAEGRRPEKGKDGWYERFFQTSFSRKPKELEDGSLDYQNIEWFETVRKGQKLMEYHDAEDGTDGCTVTGIVIKAIKGKPLPVLRGKGFTVSEDGRTYFAESNGYVELKNGSLEVHTVLTVKEVTFTTGKIIFDGDVHVQGNVSDGGHIEATGDILIDGMVEGATIRADGDIVIKNGVNGDNKGSITSKKSISSSFFEYATVTAGGSVNTNYILSSRVYSGDMVKVSGGKGSIIGGVVYATYQIQAQSVGNEAFVRTILKLGLDDNMMKKQVNIEAQLKTVKTEISSLTNMYKQLSETLSAEEKSQNEMYLKIENSIYAKKESIKRLEEEKEKGLKLIKETEKARAVITGRVFENVVVDLNGKKWMSRNTSNIIIQLDDGVPSVRIGF